jgi:hypothetical protein
MRYGNRPLLAAAVPAGTGSIRSTDPTDGGATARTLSDSPRNRLAVPGNPPETLALIAKKHRAGVIVMGAVSRSALTRFFIGNTAERVIDDVQCDVLVVKSPDFRTAVTRRVTRPVLGYPAVPPAGSATTALLPY